MGYRLFLPLTVSAMPLVAVVLALGLATPVGAADPTTGSNPFEALSGEWKGGGTVTPNKGQPLKVACKATYKVAGSTLNQHLRCAGVGCAVPNVDIALGELRGAQGTSPRITARYTRKPDRFSVERFRCRYPPHHPERPHE